MEWDFMDMHGMASTWLHGCLQSKGRETYGISYLLLLQQISTKSGLKQHKFIVFL